MAMTPDITGGLDCEESRIPRLKPIEESLQKLVQKAFASRGGGLHDVSGRKRWRGAYEDFH
jgi:hypothetical protein